jgi:hypothetical protein
VRDIEDGLIHELQADDGYSWKWHCEQKDKEIERLRELLKRQKAEIVEWLEGQGQPGYASQIHHTRWGGSDE